MEINEAMTPYGYARKDDLVCVYGCCWMPNGARKYRNFWNTTTKHRMMTQRAARKAARRQARQQIRKEIDERYNQSLTGIHDHARM